MGLLYCPNRTEPTDRLSSTYRFIAWCIDSVLIFFLYLSFLFIFLRYKMPYLGSTYSMIMDFKPDEYTILGYEEQFFFYFFIILFFFFNISYYLLCEAITSGATVGLRILYGHKIKLVHSQDKGKVSISVLFMRQFYFICVVCVTGFASFYFNFHYIGAIVLNILIINIPILGGEAKTLLDRLTNTFYVVGEQYEQTIQKKRIFEFINIQKTVRMMDKKILFPFNDGINRLLFVLWILISVYIEVTHWKLRGYGIENYAVGLIPLFLLPILYFVFLWIYYGFKKNKYD
ncbi:RDD family protein [Bacteroides heparinolyticus]|uniref:RDD family protein n=1 Tax=Prevotella heparinolytica TaxID=28113 RepID=UPI0035A1684D